MTCTDPSYPQHPHHRRRRRFISLIERHIITAAVEKNPLKPLPVQGWREWHIAGQNQSVPAQEASNEVSG
jgi:hypothetical protein